MSLTTEELAQIVNVSGLKAALKASGNKGVYNFATCSTAAGTAAKVIDTAPTSFSLKSGAVIIVKFTNAITVANATLKVGSSGTAKAIYYRGAALAANKVAAGAQLMLRYNGTQYDIIGDLDTNTGAVTSVVGQTGAVTSTQIATALTNDGKKLTDTTYKFTIGSTTKGDSTNGTDLGTLKSETAASGGTTLSLVTTGEKATWNGKLSAGFGSSKSTIDDTDSIRMKDTNGNEVFIAKSSFMNAVKTAVDALSTQSGNYANAEDITGLAIFKGYTQGYTTGAQFAKYIGARSFGSLSCTIWEMGYNDYFTIPVANQGYIPIVWRCSSLGYCGIIFPSWSTVSQYSNVNDFQNKFDLSCNNGVMTWRYKGEQSQKRTVEYYYL